MLAAGRPYPWPVRPADVRLAALIAILAFLDLAMWLTAVPLIPVWEDQLGLSHAQSGMVLGAYGVAGVRYRWATGETRPELPWAGDFIP